MSIFIRNLNAIKRNRSKLRLTKFQEMALAEIIEALAVPRHINLYGPCGVGKTFLAWFLSDKFGYTYLPSIDLLNDVKPDTVIIDNFSSDRQAYRETIYSLKLRGISKAIFITRKLIPDYVKHIRVSLTEEDIEIVRNNLTLCGISVDVLKPKNIWYFVNPTLR